MFIGRGTPGIRKSRGGGSNVSDLRKGQMGLLELVMIRLKGLRIFSILGLRII